MDAYPGQVFHGTVTSIRKAPINVQNVVTYDVVIGVANPDLKLFPGMTANVKILIDRRDGRAEGSERRAAFSSGGRRAKQDAAARIAAAGGTPSGGGRPADRVGAG